MIVKDSKDKEVEIEVYGSSVDDIQIDSATYVEDGTEVSDLEVEFIFIRYEIEIYEEWLENQIYAAEAWHDSLMDR